MATGLAPPRQRQRLEEALRRDPSDAVVPVGKQRTGTQLLPWFARPAQSPEAPVEVKEAATTQQPILSFAGGGSEFGLAAHGRWAEGLAGSATTCGWPPIAL